MNFKLTDISGEGKACDDHDDADDHNDVTEQLIKLAPTVMKELSQTDKMNEIMLKFFKLVSEKKFPLTNLSLMLW